MSIANTSDSAMTNNQKASMAFKVMEEIGFSKEIVKPILKELWNVYDGNWQLIEEDNFQVLADAVLDYVEKKTNEEIGTSLKRMCTENLKDQNEIKRVKVEANKLHTPFEEKSEESSQLRRRKRNGKDIVLFKSAHAEETPPARKALTGICIKEPVVKDLSRKLDNHLERTAPFIDDDPQPIAVLQPSHSQFTRNEDLVPQEDYSVGNDSGGKANREDNVFDTQIIEVANIPEVSLDSLEVDSSRLYTAIGSQGFKMPSLHSFLKAVQDNCLGSYQIISPDFTKLDLLELMKDIYQCFLEFGTESNDGKREKRKSVSTNLCLLQHNSNHRAPNGLVSRHHPNHRVSGQSIGGMERIKHLPSSQPSSSCSLADPQQHQFNLDDVQPLHYLNDISKGTERVKISVVNEFSAEKYPPKFDYIPQNTVYQNAYISFALARIGDEDSCSGCFGDCLSPNVVPCACARETGGEFAYTREGLVREELLDEFISLSREPLKHHHFYCKECPIEKVKNEVNPEPCKGHLVRKFVKECWNKCGCYYQCGNRIVQRGITCSLQVFMTPEDKGWGLRTLKKLPKGAFICEYVGEIVTNTELYERNIVSFSNKRHTYPVYLDADWGSESGLKDEEALCLDGTLYGNVARFINHRCSDPNLVEIPVEVETPDHHYYHLAFFTTREIAAFEELTWDYHMDFDDENHPIDAFKCKCGSKGCNDVNRNKRAHSKALVIRH
ncbi:hypothetical protein GIB67_024678 [Kingdonia uniflora]|uniref:SET domain-containing protein n=1 Tax=Kingdonia uniflora TaxID=39325 RepID=A0A7J7LP54_9MAGN|nr:hypothetical protein GIB67_024678 [Kingdonia uniflora]